MIIEWSDFALEDLEDIKHYIAKDSPYYAREFIERIFSASERLIDFLDFPQFFIRLMAFCTHTTQFTCSVVLTSTESFSAKFINRL
jgi:ParE toxin of type II toxin-antitoxin system, parDE